MDRKWWKEAVAYQIYVRSFKDSNGDGIGDLRGIIEKLDYLKKLGIDIIYLNPINKSPNDDNGYDISDFKDIMDDFGNMQDFDDLLRETHIRDMKLVMDLVINHSSDEHPWFTEAKKSKQSKYRDYYIWKKGEAGTPPNNWGSFFGGSAWEYHEDTDEYYLHLFSKKQPDLNWENNDFREDIKRVIKFWIDKGVDGFRMDAINHIAKDDEFKDGKVHEGKIYGDFLPYVQNLPKVHEYIRDIRKEINNPEIVLIGETGGISYHNAYLYTGADKKELDFTFHFDMHSVGRGEKDWERTPLNLIKDIKEKMSGWQTRDDKEGWCPLFYSNHDTTRTVSRLGNDEDYLEESAKMLATLMFTQKGTPFIYYGEEIGMTNNKGFELEDYRDVAIFNNYKDYVESGLISEENFMKGLQYTSRDNSRTPMQWNDNINGGFTKGKPWIKANQNYTKINVKEQEKNPTSILNYYKKAIDIRKKYQSLVYGEFTEINREHEEIYAYLRELETEKLLIVVNFFDNTPQIKIEKEIDLEKSELILSNYDTDKIKNKLNVLELRPYEARIYLIK
ncbi:alpha-glucosidase [Clostridiaceae bacterium M8S5]|nr:alpha-glucosidase [Clostridiaceae bacterium M8S5]